VQRQDAERHAQSAAQSHIALLLRTVQTQGAAIGELQGEVKALRQRSSPPVRDFIDFEVSEWSRCQGAQRSPVVSWAGREWRVEAQRTADDEVELDLVHVGGPPCAARAHFYVRNRWYPEDCVRETMRWHRFHAGDDRDGFALCSLAALEEKGGYIRREDRLAIGCKIVTNDAAWGVLPFEIGDEVSAACSILVAAWLLLLMRAVVDGYQRVCSVFA
jgi:hypothetical protein